MTQRLKLTDKITIGKKQKIAVSEIVNVKGEIFRLIKEGYEFDDEVLEKARIKKTVSNIRVTSEIVRPKKTDNKVYPKETESIKTILKSINTLEDVSSNTDSFEEGENINVDYDELIEE